MKDNISLIAAAAGGFMLSVALTGILRGTPVANVNAQTSISSSPMTYVNVKSGDESQFKIQKS